MDPIAQIKRLGWDWRADGMGLGLGPGVVLSVMVDDRTLRAFVPLEHVWLAFDQSLQAVGCMPTASVGAPFTVGGFFSSITSAVKSIGKAAESVVPKAIKQAASQVVNTAEQAGAAALHAVNSIPVIGTIAHATEALALLPANAAQQLVEGKRIDKIALGQFKSAIGNIKTLAPYVQTVLTMVPGIGTGISAGIGGALALAQGQNITDALMAAAKSALPGGPAAAAAFSVASDAMQGKPVTQIAIDAIPGVSPQAKQALLQGLSAARDIAAGHPVAQTVLDAAIHQLPAAAQKAVQVGVALGHAKNLQAAAAAAVHGAQALVQSHLNGLAAAQALSRGVSTPAVLGALAHAKATEQALANVVTAAQQGHPQANKIVQALHVMKQGPTMITRPGAPAPAPAMPIQIHNITSALHALGPRFFQGLA